MGGYFIALKGPKGIEEIEKAKLAIEKLGGELEGVMRVSILDSNTDHQIIIIKKIKKTPAKYPRKAGLPSKKPL